MSAGAVVGLVVDVLIIGASVYLVLLSIRSMRRARRWAWVAIAAQRRAERAYRRAARAESRTVQLRSETSAIIGRLAASWDGPPGGRR